MKKPRTIVFDIETFPAVVEVWGNRMYEENIIRVLKPWELASFAYKELGSSEVFCETRANQKSDKHLMKKLHTVLDKADVIIAHNGDKFDVKKSNTRIIKADLLPYSPLKTIDTLKVAKKNFAFTSNKLTDLGEFLGVGKKIPTGGPQLWHDCREDKPAAWNKMIKYNKQDVVLLEAVYLKLRPWIKNHPNIGLYTGQNKACPNCGSARLKSHGWTYLKTTKKHSFICKGCGAHSYQGSTILTN